MMRSYQEMAHGSRQGGAQCPPFRLGAGGFHSCPRPVQCSLCSLWSGRILSQIHQMSRPMASCFCLASKPAPRACGMHHPSGTVPYDVTLSPECATAIAAKRGPVHMDDLQPFPPALRDRCSPQQPHCHSRPIDRDYHGLLSSVGDTPIRRPCRSTPLYLPCHAFPSPQAQSFLLPHHCTQAASFVQAITGPHVRESDRKRCCFSGMRAKRPQKGSESSWIRCDD